MAHPSDGYAGRILQVDLSRGSTDELRLDEATQRKYVGGTGLGARLLYDTVPASVQWDDAGNRVFILCGPLSGTPVSGTGTYSAVFKGPMTNLAGATQASGFLGAYLKLSGLDGLAIEGVSPRWVYLYLHDGEAEIRDASHLLGQDTLAVESAVATELGLTRRQVSVHSIGPAGEHLVRYAALVGDRGHVAAHNGIGAVLGAKRVKAIAVAKGKGPVRVHDREALLKAARALLENARQSGGGVVSQWGTAGLLGNIHRIGTLPVRNYTTNVFPEHERFTGQVVRTKYPVKPNPCWACGVNHLRSITITDGPHAGFAGEEPEYESMAALGPLIGLTDATATIFLSNLVDCLGLDVNETGWTIAWVMECYERGLLTRRDLDGLEPTWGNAEAVRALLHKIAHREGCGDWLAEGVMRAARQVGAEAAALGIYTLKGASPRTHDHRGRWYEMLDTAVSGTSTIEASFGLPPGCPECRR